MFNWQQIWSLRKITLIGMSAKFNQCTESYKEVRTETKVKRAHINGSSYFLLIIPVHHYFHNNKTKEQLFRTEETSSV